ncbi:PQQ-binding-like beta-propeller repeat protein, partial [Streptomyces griseoincarnatus]
CIRDRAQTGGSAIVQTAAGKVRGLDLATGAERWTWDPSAPEDGFPSDVYVSRAFTDGQSVLLVIETSYGGRGLVALDAVSGEVAWERLVPDGSADQSPPRRSAGLVAVDGHL